jgi:hypothetical protein
MGEDYEDHMGKRFDAMCEKLSDALIECTNGEILEALAVILRVLAEETNEPFEHVLNAFLDTARRGEANLKAAAATRQ